MISILIKNGNNIYFSQILKMKYKLIKYYILIIFKRDKDSSISYIKIYIILII